MTLVLAWQGWLTLAVVLLVLVFLTKEVISPAIVMLVGASILMVTGVVTPSEFLSGFGQPILFTLAMLFVVVRAVWANGILDFVARYLFPKKGGYRRSLFSMMVPISGVSAFLNNTPIVLMMTSVVRRWALDRGEAPSRYLMFISFAAIYGGMCTLIGTATNLVVYGLLRAINPAAGYGFFELALVGIPGLVIGYLYMLTLGAQWMPERREPTLSAAAETREFIAEFRVGRECALVGKTVQEAARGYFAKEYLIEIGREGELIASPAPDELIREGDRLVLAADVSEIAKLHALPGLTSLADPKFKIDPSSSHFAEVAVALNSWLVGKTVKSALFRSRYGASVIAVYRQGKRVPGPVGDAVLHAGDTLLLLANRPWTVQREFATDLYPVVDSRAVPVFTPRRVIWVSAVLIALVIAATAGVPMIIVSACAAALLLITRSVTLREAVQGIDWRLLLLIASAFGLGGAIQKTGVAELLARGVLQVVGAHPYWLIGAIFLVTMIVTELITNVAAALILFPIALETVQLAGFDSVTAIKAVGITVAIAASSSFLTPIGYQTNTIVYGPGGYHFLDFARLGAPLSVAQLAVATLLIPTFWSFF
ncbi:MAG: SLC13 family permease [Parachlamydiales bacterium]